MRAINMPMFGVAVAFAASLAGGGVEIASAASGENLCALASKEDVSHALRVAIIRAEAPESDLSGCEFSIKGTPAAAGSGHAVELAKGAAQANGTQLDDATQS